MIRRITMVLLDDNPAAPEGVVALLRCRLGFEVLASIAAFDEAQRQVRKARPDLVLLNLGGRGDGARTLAGALHGDRAASRLIVLGRKPDHEDIVGFIRAGVAGFVMADATLDRLLGSIGAVMQGRRVLPSELTSTLFAQLTGPMNRQRPKSRFDLGQSSRLEVAAFSGRLQPLERSA